MPRWGRGWPCVSTDRHSGTHPLRCSPAPSVDRRRTEIRLRTVRWIPPPATSHPRQPGPGHLHPAALRPKSPCAGLTLYAVEALVDPRTGRIMDPGMAEYHVPVHADVPE